MKRPVYPKCKEHRLQSISITQYGYVTPCCLFASEKHFQNIRDLLGDKIEQLHITSGTLDEIISSEAAGIISDSFQNNPMVLCQIACGRPVRDNTTPANGTVEKF